MRRFVTMLFLLALGVIFTTPVHAQACSPGYGDCPDYTTKCFYQNGSLFSSTPNGYSPSSDNCHDLQDLHNETIIVNDTLFYVQCEDIQANTTHRGVTYWSCDPGTCAILWFPISALLFLGALRYQRAEVAP